MTLTRFTTVPWLVATLVSAAVCAAGCGFTQGKMLYMAGFGQRKMVPAQYKLTEGPVAILIDDLESKVDWPIALHLLEDDVGQALLRSASAAKIVPPQTMQGLRQTQPDFNARGMREVGRMAGAEQVLWIGIEDFYVTDEPSEVQEAAYMVAAVKVINALEEEDRMRVRLWPAHPEGHRVTARASAADVTRAKTRDAVSKELTHQLAETIARLFHDHRPGDFEPEA